MGNILTKIKHHMGNIKHHMGNKTTPSHDKIGLFSSRNS